MVRWGRRSRGPALETRGRTGQQDVRSSQKQVQTGQLGGRTGQQDVRSSQKQVQTGQLGGQTGQLGEQTGQPRGRAGQLGALDRRGGCSR